MILAYDEAAALRDPAVHLFPAFAAAGAEAIADVLPNYPTWRAIPFLLDHDQAFEIRLAAMGGGGKTRVDFKRVLTRHVAARFPGFQPGFIASDRYRYGKPLTPDLTLALEWHHLSGNGIGKMLELHVGARFQDKVATLSAPLPHFWGSGERATWAYTTTVDLEASLNGAADFLDAFLPPFTASLTAHMAAGTFPGAGAVTAREAFAIAEQRLASVRHAGALAFYGANLYRTAGRWGPPAGTDGRARVHGAWHLHFRDSSLNGITAIIPHLGQAKLLFGPRRAPRDEPIPKSWVDSPDAISAVFDDPRCPTEACVFDLVLGYQRPFVPAASWRVDLVVPGTGTRTLAWADAATGAAMFNERGRAVYQGQA